MPDTHALVALLEQDDIRLPDGELADKKVPCWKHNGDTLSMNVNTAEGVYFCVECGWGGTAWNYLVEDRGLSRRESGELLNRLGWSTDRIQAEVERGEGIKRKRQDAAKGRPPHLMEPEKPDSIAAVHDYKDAAGALACRVVRHNRKNSPLAYYTPCTENGGWWKAMPYNSGLPLEDYRDALIPLYALPNLLKALAPDARPDAQIFVADSEKSADAINSQPRGGDSASQPNWISPAVSLLGGTNARLDKIDCATLTGRKVCLIADASNSGRKFMMRLAAHLYQEGCTIKVALPDGETGYNIADAGVERGWYSMFDWLKNLVRAYTPPSEPSTVDFQAVPDLGDNDQFQVLGVSGKDLVVMLKSTHQIMSLAQTSMIDRRVHLMIGDYDFWEKLNGGKTHTKKDLEKIADELLRTGRRKGEMRADNTFGLGAAEIDGHTVFHVGRKLLAGMGNSGALATEISLSDAHAQFDSVFVPRPAIPLNDDPLARSYAREFHASILKYRWVEPTHGMLYLGWVVASLIGGALAHRPVLWLKANRSTGKSYLLEKTLDPLHGSFRVSITDTTEAGLAAKVGSDSIPVTIDEFEPDTTPWQRILTLMRQSTGSAGERLRGTATGGYTALNPRFSLLIASINQPKMTAADESRIFTIQLSRIGVPDWPAVNREILMATQKDRLSAVRTAIIRDTTKIVRAAEATTLRIQSTNPSIETREAQIVGALTAGCGWLSGLPADDWPILYRPTQAMQETVIEQSLSPILAVLSQADRVDGARHMTIAEMVHYGWTDEETGELIETRKSSSRGDKACRESAKRLGWRFYGGKLMMALNYPPIEALMARTKFKGVDLDSVVLGLPGVMRYHTPQGPSRLHFGSSLRYCAVFPAELLSELGVVEMDPENEEPQGAFAKDNFAPHLDDY